MSEEVNIRTKPTKSKREKPADDQINEDLRASVVQMDSLESLQRNKFQVKDPTPRSPAPIPDPISPAGVPIDINIDQKADLLDTPDNKNASNDANNTNGMKINVAGYEEELDWSVEGRKPESYQRNTKGNLMIVFLILGSVHLILDHYTMFNWVVSFDSPEIALSAVLYFISSMVILVMLLAVLIAPSLSIREDKFKLYYSPILVAGGIDFLAVCIGGPVFGPFSLHSVDPYTIASYYYLGVLITVIVNGFLYYAFTRPSGSGKLFALFHPFERIDNESAENSKSKEEV